MDEYAPTPIKTLTVKEFDAEDRPREKAARYGIQSLNNAELLAIILRAGVPGHPITEIARELMKQNDNKFLNLQRMSDEQLKQIPGIGPVKILELRVIMEIMARYHNETLGKRPQIKISKDIYDIFRHVNANSPHEEMWALFLDHSNKVLGKFQVSIGSAKATLFDVKKVLKEALLRSAEGVALCHNHPSGALIPSGQDQNLTSSFAKACKTMDLRFLDHIIISTEGYYSFADEGKLY